MRGIGLLASAVAVLVWWSTDQGGYFQKTFYPGTILLLGILVATAIGSPDSFRGLSRLGQVALGQRLQKILGLM